MFFRIKVDKFSLYYFNNYKISLMLDKESSFNSIYDIFQNEFKILKKYLNNNFIKKFIRLNSFLITLFIYFARKFNKEFRLYVNYYVFNVIIIKNRYSLSTIQEIFSRIYRIKIYITLNIIIVFNKL